MKLNVIEKFLAKEDGKQLTQYLAALCATLTLFSVGIYQGWTGPSLVKLFSDEYPIEISEEEGSYITIIGPVGHVIGGFAASFLVDYIGRKPTLIGITIPQIFASILIYFSGHSKILLYIARICQGMGEGAALSIVPCYIGEVAEPSVRGALGAFMAVTITCGTLFINIVGSFLTIHEAGLVCLLIPLIFLLTFTHMPESPYYYLMKNDTEGAKMSLKMLRRKNNVDKELMNLAIDVERQMSEKGTFTDLFAVRSNRKALTIVSLMRFFQGFTGFGSFLSYNQMMIAEATSIPPILGSSLLLSLNLLMMFLSSKYIDRIGRRSLFIASSVSCLFSLTFQAAFLTIRDYTNIETSSFGWLSFVVLTWFNLSFCGGLGPGVNVFISEIYSASIKAKAMSIGSIVFSLTYIGSTKMYQHTASYIGMAVPFYLFGAITFVGLIFFVFVVPETKGKGLEEIQQELKGELKNDIA